VKWHREGDRHKGEAELVAHVINLTAGRSAWEELLSHPQYLLLSDQINRLYNQLCFYQNIRQNKVSERHDNPSLCTFDKTFFLDFVP
jgi:hypothetical protein